MPKTRIMAPPVATQTVTTIQNITSNTTYVFPAGYAIQNVIVRETAGNAVTGGVKVGTTDGGVDVIAALAVGASALTFVLDAALLKRIFSLSATQTLYIQAVAAWNSASVDVTFVTVKIT